MATRDAMTDFFLSTLQPPPGLRRAGDPIAYWLNASPCIGAADHLHGDDRRVPGLYVVYVQKDVPLDRRADAVLDIFHSSIPVKVLDDFAFDVVDPATGKVVERSENGEDYELSSHGEFGYQLEEQPLEVAHVQVLGVLSNQDETLVLGKEYIAGQDWQDIKQKAIDLLWDEGLRTTGHSPVCQRAEEGEPLAHQPGERQR